MVICKVLSASKEEIKEMEFHNQKWFKKQKNGYAKSNLDKSFRNPITVNPSILEQ